MSPTSKKKPQEPQSQNWSDQIKGYFSAISSFTDREKKIALSTALLVLVLCLSGFFIQKSFLSTTSVSSTDLTARSTGQVALTEEQLKDTVKALKLTAYWAGPVAGNMYSLDTRGVGQVYVRYLPEGNGLTDTSALYRVVGTYEIKDAFVTTQAAGNSVPNSIGFINGDGAAVYYTKDSPNNVYIAFDGKDIQVEIFDPKAGGAIQLASTQGAISLIGS
jgi:hypothetical protein